MAVEQACREREQDRSKIYFIIPRSTLNRHRGGGQRTFAIFEALRRTAPTSVIVVGHQPIDDPWLDFPGADAVHVIPDIDLSEEGFGRVARTVNFATKYLHPRRFYRSRPDLKERIEAIAGADCARLLVFRLFPTFAASGIDCSSSKGMSVIVDVDDRDDQKARARLLSLLPSSIPAGFVERLFVRRLTKLMNDRLSNVSQAWFAAREDLGLLQDNGLLIENSAFVINRPTELPLPSETLAIIFVGPSYWQANATGMKWFLEECWPTIARRAPHVRLKIIGDGSWKEHLAGIPCVDRIEAPGFVDDIAAAYLSSRIAICPLNEGGGSKVKLIEACAYGRPLIATRHSIRGFSQELADQIVQADDAQAFAAGCLSLIDDEAEADRRGTALRNIVDKQYSLDSFCSKVQRAVETLFAKN